MLVNEQRARSNEQEATSKQSGQTQKLLEFSLNYRAALESSHTKLACVHLL